MMTDILQACANQSDDWVEMRYHARRTNTMMARAGRIDTANSRVKEGIGIRALVKGCFGFASTSDLSEQGILKAMHQALNNARSLAQVKKKSVAPLPSTSLYQGEAIMPGYQELKDMSLEDKMQQVISLEQAGQESAQAINLASCRYTETFEDKSIVTNDGAAGSLSLVRPELNLRLFAEQDGDHSSYYDGMGVTGDWQCLFNHPRADALVEHTSQMAVDLLKAPQVSGGSHNLILAPSIVGLLCHEAIGHTVEADFVQAGSVAQGKIGERVGSDLVTICDSGSSPYADHACGTLLFDDEGVPCQDTVIIEDGLLKSYLHNRESAAHFEVEPTGNARAWEFSDEPLIRMRNTYFKPGQQSLDEIIENTADGYLLEGSGGGQADSTGEFMFGVGHAVEIKNGKRGRIFKEVTVSGVAFDVLKTVDAVSNEFKWDMGTGYCGKGQPAKVDAGGPYVRCQATLGGVQA